MPKSFFNKIVSLEPANLLKNRLWHRYLPVVKNFAKFTEQYLCRSHFFNKVLTLQAANLLKKRLWDMYLSVNIAKFFRIPFYRTPPGSCFFTKVFYQDKHLYRLSVLDYIYMAINYNFVNAIAGA